MEQYTATQISQGVWKYEWPGSPASYYEIWLDGVLQLTTELGATEWTTEAGQPTDAPPPIEIHDNDPSYGKAQSQEYSPRSQLQWRGNPDATAYLVERLYDGTWRPVATPNEKGAGWYIFNTGTLIDGEVNPYRIAALDGRSVAGTSISFNVALVCNPKPPSVAIGVVAGDVHVESV